MDFEEFNALKGILKIASTVPYFVRKCTLLPGRKKCEKECMLPICVRFRFAIRDNCFFNCADHSLYND